MTPASQEFENYVVFLRNASEYEDQSLSFDEYFESTEERQMAARVKALRGKPQDQRLFRHSRLQDRRKSQGQDCLEISALPM